MQGSEQWYANNINGQGVHTKPPYPGVGRCSVQLVPCPFPVSANDVSMSPVVAPGRDAALMEFEEASVEFLSPQLPADFSTVRGDTPLGEITAPGSPLGEGDEADVEPSQTGVCDVVPPLVVWEELFNASEGYFAHGGGGTDSEKVPVEVAPLPVGFPVSDVYRPVPSGTLVLLAFVSLLVAVGVTWLLCAVFG